MNFFLCKKCDKFSEEKPVNINNCIENYNTNDVDDIEFLQKKMKCQH